MDQKKASASHHLMRVRVRVGIWEKLNLVAEEESARTGENVTASDLVRAACNNHLMMYEAVRRLENASGQQHDGMEDVIIAPVPLL